MYATVLTPPQSLYILSQIFSPSQKFLIFSSQRRELFLFLPEALPQEGEWIDLSVFFADVGDELLDLLLIVLFFGFQEKAYVGAALKLCGREVCHLCDRDK